MVPDQSLGDEFTTSLKAQEITEFTGTSTPILPFPNPAGNYWTDIASDERVTGVTLWVTDPDIMFVDDFTIKFWGTAELFVGAEEIDGEYDGKWEIKWYGTQTFTNTGYPENGPFEIVAYAVGVGTEGNVKGMFAEWTYTMDFDGNPATLFYTTEGYIAPKQLTNTLKTIKASGPFEIQFPSPDYCDGVYFRLYISGSGNCSHLGLFTVENYVCFYFEGENIVPVGQWLGYLTAANGDEIHTELIYSWEVDGLDYYLYDILDGTGRFEGASGYIENYGATTFDPDNPFIGSWNLEGEGTIVY